MASDGPDEIDTNDPSGTITGTGANWTDPRQDPAVVCWLDRDVDGELNEYADGTLYYTQDANFNVTEIQSIMPM